jgi:hypothetical protein
MASLPFPDVSVQVTQRRWRCVLDPNLALSPYGPGFARRLAQHAELWLGTEFFNILDSARIYEKEPELLAWPGIGPADAARVAEALRGWSRLRDEAGYGGSPFHWIGDVLRESCLPVGTSEDIVERWEEAARTLDARLPHAIEGTGPVIATMRDTVSLCAVLPAAVLMPCDASGSVPVLCQHVARWGIACEQLPDTDELAGIERSGIQQLLVQAGLAKFVWAGLGLAVLHLLAGQVGRSPTGDDELSDETDVALTFTETGASPRAPWDGARAFWYYLLPDRRHAD